MRNRNAYPTTPSSPTAPTKANGTKKAKPRAEGAWTYTVTEKGFRACGAANMREAATTLRDQANRLEQSAIQLDPPPKKRQKASNNLPKAVRRGTVCGRYRQHTEKRVPDLRLSGLWLRGAGFDLGQKFEVRVETGHLVIRTKRED